MASWLKFGDVKINPSRIVMIREGVTWTEQFASRDERGTAVYMPGEQSHGMEVVLEVERTTFLEGGPRRAFVLGLPETGVDRGIHAGGEGRIRLAFVDDSTEATAVRAYAKELKATRSDEVDAVAGHKGHCQIAMAPGMPIVLSAKPEGARPIMAGLGLTEDEPASVTLPVLPPIRGRVLDPEGRPVSDVAIGSTISFGPDGEGRMVPFPGSDVAFTGREGGFVIAPQVSARSAHDLARSERTKTRVLCFADPHFRRMAYRTFDPTGAIEPMEVTLGPMRRVRVPVLGGAVAAPPQARLISGFTITPQPDIPALRWPLIGRILAQKGQDEGVVVEEYLPEGTYQLEVSLTDPNAIQGLGKAMRELVVPSGEGPLDLPPLDIELSDFLKMAGKPAPEIEATDLDSGRPVTLADFRGKVVVLDFWGYWCGPCLGAMPHLMELHRKYEGQPLAIVALHDQSVQSRAEYDQKIDMVRQRIWGGRDLPFRVLLDRPDPTKADDIDAGATIKRYGIRGFPTLFVIDRDGTMVEHVRFSDHARLESLVQELLGKAEAR